MTPDGPATPNDGQVSGELISKLHTWLDKSGRALELRVARRLREALAYVRPSYAYLDSVTGTQRETDVVADFGWQERLHQTPDLPCALEVVAECKSSSKHPWVGFYEGAQRASTSNLRDWFSFAHAPYTPVLDRAPGVFLGTEPFTEAVPATHVVAARLGSSTTGGDEPNPANDAVRQVLAACEALRMGYINNQAQEKRGLFLIPVIVTAAPLFRCRLDESGDVDIQVTNQIDVWGYGSDGQRARVYILNERRLSEFATSLRHQSLRAGG